MTNLISAIWGHLRLSDEEKEQTRTMHERALQQQREAAAVGLEPIPEVLHRAARSDRHQKRSGTFLSLAFSTHTFYCDDHCHLI